MNKYIYFDNAATTKIRKEVYDEAYPYFFEYFYNPSAKYSPSIKVKTAIESARNVIAKSIDASPDEIYFTSGGSESNSWAIQGFVNMCKAEKQKPIIITSTIEHKSILECVNNLVESDVIYVSVDKFGFINIDELEMALVNNKNSPKLVSIQYANNEIGTIQNIKNISYICHKYNACFHTDAVQAFGRLNCNVNQLGIDMMSTSGHKIHSFKNNGFLYIKNGVKIKPLIYGSQERGMRGGTENVPYIIGFAKAVELIQDKNIESYRSTGKYIEQRVAYFRNYLVKRLEELGCKINGSKENRLPNNINVTLPNKVTGEALIYMMDMSGICISAGSACNSHSQSVSHVLKAIGLSEEEAMRTIRITIPDDSFNIDDINKFISELQKALKLLEI